MLPLSHGSVVAQSGVIRTVHFLSADEPRIPRRLIPPARLHTRSEAATTLRAESSDIRRRGYSLQKEGNQIEKAVTLVTL